MCEVVVANSLRHEDQSDGRIRFWGAAMDPRDGKRRILCVVTLADEVTVHNPFFDRDFPQNAP